RTGCPTPSAPRRHPEGGRTGRAASRDDRRRGRPGAGSSAPATLHAALQQELRFRDLCFGRARTLDDHSHQLAEGCIAIDCCASIPDGRTA
ncbi:hypothetical protein WDZ92_47085, partial [Nostoc sp. NIES-2111]